MRPSVLWGVAALAAAGVCVESFAQTVRVQYWAGDQQVFSRDYPSGAAISGLPVLPPGLTRINVFSVDAPANIGRISFEIAPIQGGSGEAEVDLVLGSGPASGAPGLPAAGLSFAGLQPSQNAVDRLRLSGAVSGDVTGRIECARVTRLEVGGSLGAEVYTTGVGQAVGVIRANRVGAVGADNRPGGGGPVLGVVARSGSIGAVLADTTIVIPAPGSISARLGIDDISARSVTARISANAFGGNGNLNHLGCSAGDFEGSITAHHLGTPENGMPGSMIYIVGALKGSVLLTGNLYGGVCIEGLDAATGQSAGAIKVGGDFLGLIDGPGDIGRVEILGNIELDTNSFVLPAIRTRSGSIGLLQVNGSVRGDTDLFASIQAAHINTLRVGGEATVQISAWPSGFAEVKHLEIGKSFTGAALLSDFVTCSIGGDVTAGSQIWLNGPLAPEDTLLVGRSLRGLILIDGAMGLQGQVVLNANLDPVGGWSPSGVVGLRSGSGPIQFLTRQDYERTRTVFGPGAVGVAPYALRPLECGPNANVTTPEVVSEVWPDGSTRETMRIVLDGPVAAEDDRPLEIERAEYSTTCAPGEPCGPQFSDATKAFDVLVAPDGLPREVWIAPAAEDQGGPGTFSGGWLYRISPRIVNGRSMLRAMSTNLFFPPACGNFEYRVAVDAFDMNRDGGTNESDLGAWLDQPVDFNADEATDERDFNLLLRAVELHRH